MTIFHKWQQSLAKTPEPKQVTWVCGEEQVLAEEVLTYITTRLDVAPWNIARINAQEHTARRIKAELYQYPLGPGPRLVVVRHAQEIQDWDFLTEWIPKRTTNPRTHVVFLSDEAGVQKIEPTRDQRRDGMKPYAPPHIDLITKRGTLVECRSFTNATAKYAPAWVQSIVPMRDSVAKHLMERANFQIRLVRDTCLKLKLSGVDEITITHVNQLLSEQPRDTFIDAILSRDHKTAFLASQVIPEDEYGKIIGQLDSRLDLAGLVHDMMVEHAKPGDIARAAGAQAWLVPEILPLAKHYSSKRRLELRKVLATADTAYRSGQAKGLLEVITSFW